MNSSSKGIYLNFGLELKKYCSLLWKQSHDSMRLKMKCKSSTFSMGKRIQWYDAAPFAGINMFLPILIIMDFENKSA